MIIAPVFRGNAGWPTAWCVTGSSRCSKHALRGRGAPALRGRDRPADETLYVNSRTRSRSRRAPATPTCRAFRGFDRTRYPITFLTIMRVSGLFEDVRVKIATADRVVLPRAPTAASVLAGRPRSAVARARGTDRQHGDRRRQRLHVASRATDRPRRGRHAAAHARERAHGTRRRVVDRRRRPHDRVVLARQAARRACRGRRWSSPPTPIAGATTSTPTTSTRQKCCDASPWTSAGRGIAVAPRGHDPFRDPAFIALLQEQYVRYPPRRRA